MFQNLALIAFGGASAHCFKYELGEVSVNVPQ